METIAYPFLRNAFLTLRSTLPRSPMIERPAVNPEQHGSRTVAVGAIDVRFDRQISDGFVRECFDARGRPLVRRTFFALSSPGDRRRQRQTGEAVEQKPEIAPTNLRTLRVHCGLSLNVELTGTACWRKFRLPVQRDHHKGQKGHEENETPKRTQRLNRRRSTEFICVPCVLCGTLNSSYVRGGGATSSQEWMPMTGSGEPERLLPFGRIGQPKHFVDFLLC